MQGTKIQVRVPYMEKSMGEKTTILIVDDHPVFGKGSRRFWQGDQSLK